MDFEKWIENKKNEEIVNDIINHNQIKKFINDVFSLLFPGYIERVENMNEYITIKLIDVKNDLLHLLKTINDIEIQQCCKDGYECILNDFFNELPKVEELLKTDIDALYDGDPAAYSKKEIVISYPGFRAIYIYRIAHVLQNLNIAILPRAMTEYAHSKTGIDIHPAAKIGPYFFIDHGTGIVIGETVEIGKNVKIYQGVTLGALSLRAGSKLKGKKRHPTIEDNVTIYSNASIFGGETIIGEGSTIGSNTYIVSSVEANSVVTISGNKNKR